MPATVWVKPLNSTWQPIGGLADRGAWHEDLTLASDQWGPKSASFTLKRQPRGQFPDLLTQTPVIVEHGAVRVWRGRIKDVPEQSGAARQLTVQCEGGQYLLDDGSLERKLVHTDLGAWKDMRSFLGAPLGPGVNQLPAAAQVNAQDGALVLSWSKDQPWTQFAYVAVMLDLGPGQLAKRISVDWTASATDANTGLFVRGTSTPDFTWSGSTDAIGTSSLTAGAQTQSGSLGGGYRYVQIMIYRSGATATPTSDISVKVTGARVYADTAYESSDASILDAATIIRDALTRTSASTGLHPDWSGIGAPAFAFPNFAPDQPRTTRELITAANAPHGWRFKVDEQLRPLYRALATAPVIDLGAWLGAEGDTGSSNSDEGIATTVIVIGTGPDGTPIRSTRTQTGTIIDRQGGSRDKALTTNFKLNSTLADKLGDTYLVTHRLSPFKGQSTLTAGGARRAGSGASVHPAHLLLLTSELARRTDLIDPDTGALGRNAVIDQVTYHDSTETAEVDLDNTRRDFEALQERLGLLVPA